MIAHDLQLSNEPGESQSQAMEEYWDAVDAEDWDEEEDGDFLDWEAYRFEEAAARMQEGRPVTDGYWERQCHRDRAFGPARVLSLAEQTSRWAEHQWEGT